MKLNHFKPEFAKSHNMNVCNVRGLMYGGIASHQGGTRVLDKTTSGV